MGKLLEALGAAIRELRQDRRLSQERLAAESGLHRTYVSSVELGHRNLSIVNLQRIARALGVDMTEIVRLCEDRLESD